MKRVRNYLTAADFPQAPLQNRWHGGFVNDFSAYAKIRAILPDGIPHAIADYPSPRPELPPIEAQIEANRRMGQRPDADPIDAGRSDRADRIEPHPARSLEHHAGS